MIFEDIFVILSISYNVVFLNMTLFLGRWFVFCNCGKSYKRKSELNRHQRYECGKERQFPCPHCPYRGKHRQATQTHIALKHSQLY